MYETYLKGINPQVINLKYSLLDLHTYIDCLADCSFLVYIHSIHVHLFVASPPTPVNTFRTTRSGSSSASLDYSSSQLEAIVVVDFRFFNLNKRAQRFSSEAWEIFCKKCFLVIESLR